MEVERISLLDSLEGEWLKLPTPIMRDVGPAVQTLAGILRITNRETFCAATEIAKRARLPLPTVRKHLMLLADHGWITNAGRGHTKRGAPRRTCTIRITPKTTNALDSYGVLPWWACGHPTNASRLTWSARAVLSMVMARLMAGVAAHNQSDGLSESLQNDRFRFSLTRLQMSTGLSRPGVVAAKRELKRVGVIHWQSDKRDDGGDAVDYLIPSSAFTVLVTPTANGRCYLEFDGGKKVGNTG